MKSKLQCPKCGREFEYKWVPTVVNVKYFSQYHGKDISQYLGK